MKKIQKPQNDHTTLINEGEINDSNLFCDDLFKSSIFLSAPESVIEELFSQISKLESPQRERVFLNFCLRKGL